MGVEQILLHEESEQFTHRMVGTPESAIFFEQAMQLARRSLGVQYGRMEYDEFFEYFCEAIFSYQYTKNASQFTPGISEWLYEHSSGIISVVVSLIHDAQEIAILNGKEMLNLESLNMAYQQRMSMLHGFIVPKISNKISPAPKTKKAPAAKASAKVVDGENTISQLASMSREQNLDMLTLLRDYVPVVEVTL